jgi:hypothetical protein
VGTAYCDEPTFAQVRCVGYWLQIGANQHRGASVKVIAIAHLK